ncbi:nitroreductase family protein [Sinorhizobium alkalisoli]|uniref:Nitroreductase n=1 Tax=Sinorhizobium alkalisoli TaxID=1752398 RepID=A0A1E3VBQ0_9HYPH|nr:nitroreductase family protein [Sinorhizobium alkalisoli]MCA1493352.1 nitroreductase family protein [Ensifer sp. NBAIM29]MCG5485299.1 nitroreductase family protein [Sinorhizobium meliloti]ODR91018.1 nitroreductase [Sinorhizobium alkalisoli]QFI68155.1 Nitroreductase family protein [Sinorhizobium alkalisoli]
MTEINQRKADHPIHSIFLERWSPRAFTGEDIGKEELLALFEAARWAPSASNLQPWRFVYARRGTDSFARLLGTLDEGNQRWAKKASALVIILSKTHRVTSSGEIRPAFTHAFDTGAAWFALALQTQLAGWYAHAMAGIDREKAMQVFEVPEHHRVEAAVAIGRLAEPSTLPDDLREREKPSQRKPIGEFVFEGRFGTE